MTRRAGYFLINPFSQGEARIFFFQTGSLKPVRGFSDFFPALLRPLLHAGELARVIGDGLEVVLAIRLQFLRLESAFGMNGEYFLVSAKIRRG